MKIKILGTIIFILFVFLVAGLFYLQVIRGGHYLEESLSNRIRLEVLQAPRGRILDRNGRLIVGNRISFDIAVIPQEISEKKEKVFSGLGAVLGIPVSEIENTYNKIKTSPPRQ